MSEPIGIIAKIKLPETNYKKYVSKVAAQLLAGYIFDCIKLQPGDYYIFRYLKKEQALYAFFYFNYGDSPFLLNHPLLEMLKNITTYANDACSGYLVTSVNILDYAEKDFPYAASMVNGKWLGQPLDETQLQEYRVDAQKYFFTNVEMEFSLAMHGRQIVDPAIIKRVEKLREEDRVQFLKNNLDRATLENPQEFFTGYFYNGCVLYAFNEKNEVVVFENIHIQALRQTSYGLCDDKGIIVGHVYMATDPTQFKKHQKGEMLYYSSAEMVYNEKLEPYPDSDSRTFRMLGAYAAEDKRYIYFGGKQLQGKDSQYTINDSGYFRDNILFYSKTKVCTVNNVLEEIDAASFEVISKDAQTFLLSHGLANPSGVYAGCFVLHCRDKKGEFIIHNYDIYKTSLQVEYISSLVDYIAKTKVLLLDMAASNKNHFYPDYREGQEKDFYIKMNQWLSGNFDALYESWKHNPSFYRAIRNYLFSCFQLYKASLNKLYLSSGVALFEKVNSRCFVYPYIFPIAAYIYSALGDVEKAILSVSSALHYGYRTLDLMWNDKNLSTLFQHPDFIALKNYYEQIKERFPVVNMAILDKIEGMAESIYKTEIAVHIGQHFTFPDTSRFYGTSELPADQRSYVNLFTAKVARLINYLLQQHSCHYADCYSRFKDAEFVTIQTHLFALSYFFFKSHHASGTKNIAYCFPIAEKIKELLAQYQDEEEIKLWTEKIKETGINKIFNIV